MLVISVERRQRERISAVRERKRLGIEEEEWSELAANETMWQNFIRQTHEDRSILCERLKVDVNQVLEFVIEKLDE